MTVKLKNPVSEMTDLRNVTSEVAGTSSEGYHPATMWSVKCFDIFNFIRYMGRSAKPPSLLIEASTLKSYNIIFETVMLSILLRLHIHWRLQYSIIILTSGMYLWWDFWWYIGFVLIWNNYDDLQCLWSTMACSLYLYCIVSFIKLSWV